MMDELRNRILDAFDKSTCPMSTIYGLCFAMGEPQRSSTHKFYVKVYRKLEKMVETGDVWVMRGTRDPSVYLPKRVVKGYDKNGVGEIPF